MPHKAIITCALTGVLTDPRQHPVPVTAEEIAACNAGSLNYLKVRSDGSWAWPPRLFDNPVEKVKAYLDVMAQTATQPEFECFDTGIVRCVEMYARNGM